jgi:hypothetical protein
VSFGTFGAKPCAEVETFPVVLSASVSLALVTAPLLIFAVVTALFAIVAANELVPEPVTSPVSVIV